MPLLLGLQSCLTCGLWHDDGPQTISRQHEFHPRDVRRPAIESGRFAICLTEFAAKRLSNDLPFLESDTRTLWVVPVDEAAWQAWLQVASKHDPQRVSIRIEATRGTFFDRYNTTMDLGGSTTEYPWLASVPGVQLDESQVRVSLALPCTVEADKTNCTATATDSPLFSHVDLVITTTSDESFPVPVRVLLTPITVVADVVLLPFELLGGYLMMKAFGY